MPEITKPNIEVSHDSSNAATNSKEAELAGIAKMLDIGLWDHNDHASSPMSPIRSPVVADWKVVGSPVVSASTESMLAFDDSLELNQRELPAADSCMQQRRQRAMSLVEKSLSSHVASRSFTPFPPSSGRSSRASLTNESASFNQDALNQPQDKLGPKFGAQVAQLPNLLQEELGVSPSLVSSLSEKLEQPKEDPTMESTSSQVGDRSDEDHDNSESKNLSSMPSLFGSKMPFGPAAMLFSGKDLFSMSAFGEDSMTASFSSSSQATGENSNRRHSSLFGLSEWAFDHQGTTMGSEFSIDDYFLGAGNVSKLGLTSSKRPSRRHSLAATMPEVEDHLSSMSLSSVHDSGLSANAASFYYKGPPYTSASSSATNLLDYFSMSSSGEYGGHDGSSYPSISSSAARDASFQLSTYKGPLYAVEFKAGRTEIFYVLEIDCKPQLSVRVGDLVIVEADRGEDLGKVTMEISVAKLKNLMMPGSHRDLNDKDSDIVTPELAALVHSKEIVPKRIHRLALSSDLKLLQAKAQEEAIAMVRCQSRIRQKKLPMEVVDAEYQWDRNKLTFYFCADRRIDFRELVRDLFRIYKTRIWMCAVDKSSPRMLMYTPGSSQNTSSSSADYGGTYYGSSYPAISLSPVLPL